jgi:hypothetical protein
MNVQMLEHEAEYALNSVEYIILWYITSAPQYAPLVWGTTVKLPSSLLYVYIIFTHAYCPANIVFNVKSLHIYFWTKMSILAFIPTHNDGQICPFRLLKVNLTCNRANITKYWRTGLKKSTGISFITFKEYSMAHVECQGQICWWPRVTKTFTHK